ncbi:ATP-binding cassette domain-containing protein [Rubinisphaera margarita]|uniref:ATP-binding cassette domain-containing protein n=1 Tax=Rubinisphaera margarita TaxID=2909586 RepID=UPI001EE78940|nr:ATP-binding cassette domain-containing protein [Rubinisphaera margarita]MCG6154887.1 hypothetical protein [Rubinisphaera margarita]
MLVSVAYDFLPKRRTVRTSQVMDCFGVDFEQGRYVLAEELELAVEAGQVVCFTGDSGSGKSSLMRAAAGQLEGVLDIDSLELEQVSLIDGLGLDVAEGLRVLGACGLGEAQVMLRTPAELSDGQRYRYRLAKAIADQPQWILADEFTATLDRTLAKVIAFNVRKICSRMGIGFLLATTHEDVVVDLEPDVHVRCRLGEEPVVVAGDCDGEGDAAAGKKSSASPMRSGSVRRPGTTGRISLGGITERMRLDSSCM